MELLKSKIIIDSNYVPSLKMGYIDYFMRAMAFAQTNYQDQLDKISKAHFHKLSPSNFFEEYVWVLSCVENDPEEVSKFFPALSKQLTPFFQGFWDLNSFPKLESVKDNIISINHDDQKTQALFNCATIIHRGIKLFSWDKYKKNFLNNYEKLSILPMIGIQGARQLSRNTGTSSEIINTAKIQKLANHWGFSDCQSLCMDIRKNINLQPRIIEMILWYTVHTFGANI